MAAKSPARPPGRLELVLAGPPDVGEPVDSLDQLARPAVGDDRLRDQTGQLLFQMPVGFIGMRYLAGLVILAAQDGTSANSPDAPSAGSKTGPRCRNEFLIFTAT